MMQSNWAFHSCLFSPSCLRVNAVSLALPHLDYVEVALQLYFYTSPYLMELPSFSSVHQRCFQIEISCNAESCVILNVELCVHGDVC